MPITRGLNRTLRAWQHDALEAWQANGRRGIIEAATGTGKTLVALAAVDRLDDDDLRVAIVVPKIVLLDQWRSALRDNLGVQPRDVGAFGGGGTYHGQKVVLFVINSARRDLTLLVRNWKQEGCRVLLIVDECHWSGSEKNSKIFDVACNFTLGLSATPERSDDGFDEVLEPQLGAVVYRYPLRQALDDGVLAPLRCVDLYLDLDPDEQGEYDELSDRIRQLRQTLESRYPELAHAGDRWPIVLRRLATSDTQAEELELRLFKRRRLVSSVRSRQACLQAVLDSRVLEGRKAIIFHETIETAELTYAALSDRGYLALMDHSRLKPQARERAHKGFRSRRSAVLVAVKTVDEGIDIPDAELAVIMSGTLTGRQRIQRIGRILRPSGSEVMCISLLARGTTEETLVGAHDCELLGTERVTHHRWPTTSLAKGIANNRSTYQPTSTDFGSRRGATGAAPPAPPKACPACGLRPSGNFAVCAKCGASLNDEMARRQNEGPSGRLRRATQATGKHKRRSMADDPKFKKCPHCATFIMAASTNCRHCHRRIS
jgi:superfamily II DNA or RNA helicase